MTGDALDSWGLLQLYAAYAHSIDDGDARRWAACFSEDGVLWSSRGTHVVGAAALEQFARTRILERTAPERHVSWHHVFEPADGAVAGRCSAALLRPTATGAALMFSATYRDLLRHDGSRWRLLRRDVLYDEADDTGTVTL